MKAYIYGAFKTAQLPLVFDCIINVIEGVPLLGQNAIITEEDRLFGPGISDPMRSAIVMSPNL